MKLALSGRLWETPKGYTADAVEQIEIAARLGYGGLEVRYPQVPQVGEWDAIRGALKENNVQHVFSPAAGVPDSPEKEADFVRVLDAIAYWGGPFLKIIPRDENDIPAMRRAADLGAQRGIKVLSQYHANTLTDTVAKTENFFAQANHPNLGLIFDSCHIPFSEELSIEEAVERLYPFTDLVNLQSYKPSLPDDGLQHSTINGREWSLALPGDAAGTDMALTVKLLREKGYNGWYTAMPAVDPSADPLAVAQAYTDFGASFLR